MRRLVTLLALGVVAISCVERDPPAKAPAPAYPQQQYSPASYGQQPYAQPGYAPQPAPASNDRYAAARQHCLDQTNAYRARVGAAPLGARPDKAACTDTDARGDATQNTVHGESGQCGLSAQNECPGWPGTADGIVSECLKSMFDEGPGEPYSAHGHFINMTGKDYRGLECGFFETNGKVWLVQNYFF